MCSFLNCLGTKITTFTNGLINSKVTTLFLEINSEQICSLSAHALTGKIQIIDQVSVLVLDKPCLVKNGTKEAKLENVII